MTRTPARATQADDDELLSMREAAAHARLLTKTEAAGYCGMSPSGFTDWQRRGLVPGPLPGTRKWDSEAIKLALDRLSGLAPSSGGLTPLQQWRAKRGQSAA